MSRFNIQREVTKSWKLPRPSVPAVSSTVYLVAAILLGMGSRAALAQPQVENKLFVANRGNLEGQGQSITVYDRTASGDVAPVGKIPPTVTTRLGTLSGLAVDRARSELVVLNFDGNFSNGGPFVTFFPLGIYGNVPPSRFIEGAATGLSGPWGLALDTVHNELVVANDTPSVTIYDGGAGGNVAPRQILIGAITGLSRPAGPVVDTVRDKLVVANYGNNSITVYDRMSNSYYNPIPSRTIAGPTTGLNGPLGLALDTVHNELLVANLSNNSITVYDLIRVYDVTDTGDVPATRSISGLFGPAAVAVDTVNDELAVAEDFNGGYVTVYPRGSFHELRSIHGSSTELYIPSAVAITTACPPLIMLSPVTLPNGMLNTAYTQTTLTPTPPGTYTFTVTGLPAGMTPTSPVTGPTVTIGGTPTGTSGTVTVSGTDGNNCPFSQNYSLTIDTSGGSSATITSGNTATFTVGAVGSFQVTTTGIPAPQLFNSSPLPIGLSFADNTNGTAALDGTPGPNAAGVYPLTLTADNGIGSPDIQNFVLTVEIPYATSFTGQTPDGQEATATLSGGGSSCLFSRAAFIDVSGDPRSPQAAPPSGIDFPKGLFNFATTGCDGTPVTITITYPSALPYGTVYEKYGPQPGPIAADWYQLSTAVISGNTVTLTISDGGLGDDDLAVNGSIVDPGGPAIPPATAPAFTDGPPPASATVGTPYSFTYTASGTTPVTFSLTAGALPSGLSLGAGGDVSGIPTTPGTFTGTVTASNGTPPDATQNFTLTVNQAPAATHFSVAAPVSVTAGNAFNLTVRALDASNNTVSGYTGTVHFTSTDAQAVLPSNYTFLAGDAGVKTFSVTLKTAGSRTVTATDTSTSITGTATVGVNAGSPASIMATAGTPQSAAINMAFATNLSATVRDSSNNLVGGVVVTFTAPSSGASGTFAGGVNTATTNGSGIATAPVFTANGTTGSYTVAAAFSAAASPASFSLTNTSCAALSINPAELPGAMKGAAYRQKLTASGGTMSYRFGVTDGSLPSGLKLSGEGVISGRPTAAGSFRFTVTAVGANGCRGSRSYTLVVSCAAITINPPTLRAAKVGKTYSRTLTAVGGAGEVTFAVSEGSLPPGLHLSAETPEEAESGEDEGSHATLSGVPTQPGSFAFTITATDSNACMGSRSYVLVIISSKS